MPLAGGAILGIGAGSADPQGDLPFIPSAARPPTRLSTIREVRFVQCMQLQAPGKPLEYRSRELGEPAPGQVRIRVAACGVCRTDLHLVDGELPDPRLPIVPGHEIVGLIEAVGPGVALEPGQRVGVPWLGWTCGRCDWCRRGQENLCPEARFTGYQIDGGYATFGCGVIDAGAALVVEFDGLEAGLELEAEEAESSSSDDGA